MPYTKKGPFTDGSATPPLNAAFVNGVEAALFGAATPYFSPTPSGSDDTVALNAWTATLGAGKIGVLQPGSYSTTGTVNVPAGARITGYGATITANQPGNNFNVITITGSDVHLAGFTITTDWTRISTTGVYATGVDGAEVRDLHIYQIAGKGIWLDHATNFSITNCALENTLAQAINLDFCTYGRIHGNRINTAQHGIQYWGGDSGTSDYNLGPKTGHLTITGNIVRNGNTDGTTAVSAGIWGSLGQWITIVGNVVENWNDFCIDLEGTYDSVVSGNTCNEGKNGILGVNNGSQRCVFDGNTCTNVTFGGPGFRSDWGNSVTYASADLKITNNYFRTPLAGVTAAYRSTAEGSSLQRSVFSDNVVHCTTTQDLYAGLLFVFCPEMSVERNRVTVTYGQSGIRMIGCSNGNINGNKVFTANAGTSAASTGGGISLEWYNASWPAQHNVVRGNMIRGFGWGIYDKVSADPGWNLFDGNMVNQIIHNDGGGYKGYNGNNRSDTDPTVASGFIAANP